MEAKLEANASNWRQNWRHMPPIGGKTGGIYIQFEAKLEAYASSWRKSWRQKYGKMTATIDWSQFMFIPVTVKVGGLK